MFREDVLDASNLVLRLALRQLCRLRASQDFPIRRQLGDFPELLNVG